MGKFATVITTDLRMWEGKEKELAELNKERMRVVGYESDYANIVVCPHCGKESLAGPNVRNGGIINKLPEGWKRKQAPRDLAREANPPDEAEIQAKKELIEAQKAMDRARADMGNLLLKLNKGTTTFINTAGEYQSEKSKYKQEESAQLTTEAQNILNEKAEVWQKAKIKYDNLFSGRMQRIQQYRMNEEKKAIEKLEQAKQKKKSTNWRGKIKEIVSMEEKS